MTAAPLADAPVVAPAPPPEPASQRRAAFPRGLTRPGWNTPAGRERIARVATAVLATAAALIVGFVAFAVVAQGWVEHREQAGLQASFQRVVNEARAGGPQSGGFFASAARPKPPVSRAVALIDVPAIHLIQAVLGGATAANLQSGPALVAGGPQPGAAGNVVIAGHRTIDGGPFYHLDQLKPGDLITIDTAKGKFVYDVVGVDVVPPGDRRVLQGFSDSRLTLVAGDPVFRESHPLAVQALLLSSHRWPNATPPSGPTRPNAGVPDIPGSGAGWWWILAGGALATATGAAARRWLRRSVPRTDRPAALLLAGPVVLAGACLAFHGAALILPATI